jgi:exonuclease SbcD
MKILHTADWHLGNVFHGHNRIGEHRHFLAWLLDTLKEECPDVLVIAGDIFDSPNPSAAAEEMFYNFLVDASEAVMGMQIVAIAGNHDSAGRIDAPAQLLHRHNVYVRGTLPRNPKTGEIDYERLIIPLSKRSTTEPEMVCLAVPYLRPSDYPVGMGNGEGLRGLFSALLQEVNKGPHKGLPIISVAHFYAAGSEICENEHSERLVIGGQDCVEADVVGKNVCYTALGHLHKAQKVKSAVREMQYSGSPIPMSFSESHYQHGLTLVEIDAAGNVETQRIVYTPQRPLTTLPARGSARTSEILRMIESLPQRRKNDSGESWPYLELRIEENQPEPTLLYQITTALEDKAVHFCRVVRVYQRENTLSAAHQTTNMLQELSPVEMADLVYKDMYEEPLPEELKQRLIIAEEAALSE